MAAKQTIRLPILDLRDYQRELFAKFDEGFKRIITVWPRRHGKDLTAINLAAREMFRRVGTYYIILPFYQQARKIYWEGATADGRRFLDFLPPQLVKSRSKQDMTVEAINGSILRLVGSDNPDSIVGTNPVGIIFSEFSLQDPICWDLMRPVLRENGGWAYFNGTPRGKNHLYKLIELVKDRPDWWVSVRRWQDLGVLTQQDIEDEIASGMDPDLVRQEFECSFTAGVKGTYWGHAMEEAREQKRIGRVPYDEAVPVFTFWDLGHNDQTAIWFVQFVGREVHAIDYYENHDQSLPHYLSVIHNKPYSYAEHWLPHDAKAKNLQTGKTTQEVAEDWLHGAGSHVPVMTAPRPNNKDDAIKLARSLIRRTWFDEQLCPRGIECLESYARSWDEKRKVFINQPMHNWASHGADAWQTVALSDIPEIGNPADTGGMWDDGLLYDPDSGRTVSDFSVFGGRR